MTDTTDLMWKEIRALYVKAFKKALKEAEESYTGGSLNKPAATAFEAHPYLQFGVAVRLEHEYKEPPAQLENTYKAIDIVPWYEKAAVAANGRPPALKPKGRMR